MKNNRRKRFAAIMHALGEAYDNTFTDAKMEVYYRILEGVPIEKIEENAWLHMKKSVYFPKPVELSVGTGKALELHAIRAFDVLNSAMATIGTYHNVCFTDHVINKVVESMGGLIRLGERNVEQWLVWGRKEFIDGYLAFHALSREQVPKYLAGRFDGELSESRDIKMVGDHGYEGSVCYNKVTYGTLPWTLHEHKMLEGGDKDAEEQERTSTPDIMGTDGGTEQAGE